MQKIIPRFALLGSAVALLVLATAAHADEASPVGTQTRAWTKLQASGAAAAQGPPRGVPGEVADRVYERYLKSFTQPIPERLERERIGGEASSK